MELNRETTKRTFYRVDSGKLLRTPKDGEKTIEKNGYQYTTCDGVQGRVTGIKTVPFKAKDGTEYTKVVLSVSDGQETASIDVMLSGGGYCADLILKVSSIVKTDIDAEYRFFPYEMEDRDVKDMIHKGFSVQDLSGERIKRDPDIQLPAYEKVVHKKKETWDDTERQNALLALIEALQPSFQGRGNQSDPAESEIDGNPDDLPF